MQAFGRRNPPTVISPVQCSTYVPSQRRHAPESGIFPCLCRQRTESIAASAELCIDLSLEQLSGCARSGRAAATIKSVYLQESQAAGAEAGGQAVAMSLPQALQLAMKVKQEPEVVLPSAPAKAKRSRKKSVPAAPPQGVEAAADSHVVKLDADVQAATGSLPKARRSRRAQPKAAAPAVTGISSLPAAGTVPAEVKPEPGVPVPKPKRSRKAPIKAEAAAAAAHALPADAITAPAAAPRKRAPRKAAVKQEEGSLAEAAPRKRAPRKAVVTKEEGSFLVAAEQAQTVEEAEQLLAAASVQAPATPKKRARRKAAVAADASMQVGKVTDHSKCLASFCR